MENIAPINAAFCNVQLYGAKGSSILGGGQVEHVESISTMIKFLFWWGEQKVFHSYDFNCINVNRALDQKGERKGKRVQKVWCFSWWLKEVECFSNYS